jgi:DNA-binding IclR family transcriptional regulator
MSKQAPEEDASLAKNTLNPYSIKTVERALEIFDLMCAKKAPVSISEVAQHLDVSSNMAYRLLMSLRTSGYLEQNRNENDLFYFTLKILEVGSVALNQCELRTRSAPFLQSFWVQFRAANVNLAVLENDRVIQIERIDSDRLPRTYATVGRVLPPHATALGKMLISELNAAELHRVVGDPPFPKYTDNTIETLEELRNELRKIRKERVAWDRGEQISGDHCVAAPVRDKSRRIIGAVSLSALEIHISPDELHQAVVPLLETTRSISQTFGFLS